MRYVVHIRANTYIHDSWKDIFLEITTVILFPKIEPTLFKNQRFDLNLKYIFGIRKLAYSLLIFHSFKKKVDGYFVFQNEVFLRHKSHISEEWSEAHIHASWRDFFLEITKLWRFFSFPKIEIDTQFPKPISLKIEKPERKGRNLETIVSHAKTS